MKSLALCMAGRIQLGTYLPKRMIGICNSGFGALAVRHASDRGGLFDASLMAPSNVAIMWKTVKEFRKAIQRS